MRTTIARIGATSAGALLAVGLFAAAPAGASGSGGHGINSQDSTCFTATGHAQGRSHSDPDGMSNGGADKPGCPGGVDKDRDGNNGCGNDADREDDNNGWCGRKPKGDDRSAPAPTPKAAPTPTTTTSTTTTTVAPPAPATVEPTVEPSDCQVDPKEAQGCDQTTATGDASTSDAGTEVQSHTDDGSSPIADTSAGVGGLSLLGALLFFVRRLLRIG